MGENTPTSVEDIMKLGRYTIFLCIMAEIMIYTQLSNMYYMVYAGISPTITACGEYKFESYSGDACDIIEEVKRNFSCKPELNAEFASMNIEFEYICEKSRVIKDSISLQMVGVIVGSTIFGYISDSYGRKLTMTICLSGIAFFGILSAFSTGIIMLTILRTITGIFNGGQISSLLVFMVENLPKKHRLWINILISWSPNIAIMAVVAYYSINWRILAVTTSGSAIPALIILCFMNESPRWLLQKGRTDEAYKVLKKIAHCNGENDISDETINNIITNERRVNLESNQKKRKYYLYHLFYTRQLALHTTALAFSFMVSSIVNYGLLFNMDKLSGSIFVNNLIVGFARYVVNMVTAILDCTQKRFGRIYARAVTLLPIILALISILIVHVAEFSSWIREVTRIATIVVFACAGQMYVINGIISSELFPTPIRSTAYSFLQIVSRVGVVMGPQIFFLSDYWNIAPYLLMITLVVLDFTCFPIIIPETKGRPLKDRMPTREERILSTKKELVPLAEENNEKSV